MPLFEAVWKRLREFSGFGNEASYLWPRWIVLRGVGLEALWRETAVLAGFATVLIALSVARFHKSLE